MAANAVSKNLTEKHGGDLKPEYRLPPIILGSLCTPISLFWYGWSAQARVHWIVPIVGTAFIGMGMVFTYARLPVLASQRLFINHMTNNKSMPSAMYLVGAYTVHAASVTAASTISRCLLGALLPLAGPAMYDTLGLGWGNSLLGFISIAIFPVLFHLYRYW